MPEKTKAMLADRVKEASDLRKALLSEIDEEIKVHEDRLKVLRAQRMELGTEYKIHEVIRDRTIYQYNPPVWHQYANGTVVTTTANSSYNQATLNGSSTDTVDVCQMPRTALNFPKDFDSK